MEGDKQLELKFDDNALLKSIELHGRKLKEVICVEEMSELTKEICKDLRGETRRDNLVEEFSDVLICMRMLSLMHNIQPKEVQKWIDFKVIRQIGRDEEYFNKLKEAGDI